MFCFRTIHLVFGLILIGAVKAVPMPPSGTTSKSPEPPLDDYYNYLITAELKNYNSKYIRSTPDLEKNIRSKIKSDQQVAYQQSGWIQVTIFLETCTDKRSPAPSTRNLMSKEEAGVSKARESMLRESIQRWSGREVPWDKALGVQVIYDGGLKPGQDCFHYYVSWVHKKPPVKVDRKDGSIGDVVFMQVDRELPKGWSKWWPKWWPKWWSK
ncbi:hypothetical protein FB446DRAFT_793679 [Lentinula raphanica]|nr:hypothetical protein FB446DRAFT_793679 [Lentinula raphanica]